MCYGVWQDFLDHSTTGDNFPTSTSVLGQPVEVMTTELTQADVKISIWKDNGHENRK